MARIWTSVTLSILLVLTIAQEVKAQADSSRAFLNINVAAQPQQRDFEVASSLIVYDEDATLVASQHIGNGALFDISGGYRLRRKLFLGAGFSNFSNKSDGIMVASVPHPVFFNLHKVVTQTVPDLKHTERAFSVQLVYAMPVAEKMDLALSIGPTFIRVSQDVVNAFSVTAGTQDVTPTIENQSTTTTGVMLGADLSYMLTRRMGVGIFLRYAGASTDLPSVTDLSVGGVQAGIGLRARF